MHLEVIYVACRIKLPEDLKRLPLWQESLYIHHVRPITEHASVVTAIQGEYAYFLEYPSCKVALELGDIVESQRLIQLMEIHLPCRIGDKHVLCTWRELDVTDRLYA